MTFHAMRGTKGALSTTSRRSAPTACGWGWDRRLRGKCARDLAVDLPVDNSAAFQFLHIRPERRT